MPRTKGVPKTGGRQKGTKNRTSEELKKCIFDIVSEFYSVTMNTKDFKEKFKNLPFDTQLSLITKLTPFVLAKQTENKISVDAELSNAIKQSSDKINGLFNKVVDK